jgi:Fic family protein
MKGKVTEMQPEDFSENKWGELVKAAQGYWAFKPNNLPPNTELTWSLVNALSQADRALANLAGTARNLRNPHLLIRPFIRREAVLSSRIEGTQASLSDLFFFEAAEARGERPNPSSSDVSEVANYARSLEYGLERLSTLPLSLRLIREIHRKLLTGVRGQHQTPGEFRLSQNWIGPPGCTLTEAAYVPPPVPEMEEALDALEKYLHEPSDIPPLIWLAFIHYQFEAIHPFLDGNGRIGRLLTSLLMCSRGLLPQPLLYLSAYFEKHRREYYDGLLSVSQRGYWTAWIEFFLRGVAEQAKDVLLRTERLLNLWQSYREKFSTVRSSSLLQRLIDGLFESPVLTIPRAALLLEITRAAAALHVKRLLEAGILSEIQGRRHPRLFLAESILNAIEDPMDEPSIPEKSN